MIKVVFFDCDGTLLSHKTKCIPQSARLAIKLLQERGIKVVLATGRHYQELLKLPVDGIDFDGYILLNGQICLDHNKQVLFVNPIKDNQQIKDLFNEKSVPVQILHLDDIYINYVDNTVRKTLTDVSTPLTAIGKFKDEPIYQAICYGALGYEDRIKAKLPNCKLTRWNDGAIDITPINGDKVQGIKKYCQIYKISQQETMSFGDGVNDVDMLKYTHISVAMANGDDICKKVASYVTTDIDEDGVYKAYIKYFS